MFLRIFTNSYTICNFRLTWNLEYFVSGNILHCIWWEILERKRAIDPSFHKKVMATRIKTIVTDKPLTYYLTVKKSCLQLFDVAKIILSNEAIKPLKDIKRNYSYHWNIIYNYYINVSKMHFNNKEHVKGNRGNNIYFPTFNCLQLDYFSQDYLFSFLVTSVVEINRGLYGDASFFVYKI